ncbi:MAG TPA: hypothetical protein VHW94_10070 [Candidatus Dormibacteraeota bacterium]|jgi:hypothetical protein|nr:hypothetical protein [Candidatus Dormibacteraeota bacterium]
MRNEGEGDTAASDLLVPRGSERRGESTRRTTGERRFGERRDPVRAAAGRRVLFPFDRRIAERRTVERREFWPEPNQ